MEIQSGLKSLAMALAAINSNEGKKPQALRPDPHEWRQAPLQQIKYQMAHILSDGACRHQPQRGQKATSLTTRPA